MHTLLVKEVNKQREVVESVVFLRHKWFNHWFKFKLECQFNCFFNSKLVAFFEEDAKNTQTACAALTNLSEEPKKTDIFFCVCLQGMFFHRTFVTKQCKNFT